MTIASIHQNERSRNRSQRSSRQVIQSPVRPAIGIETRTCAAKRRSIEFKQRPARLCVAGRAGKRQQIRVYGRKMTAFGEWCTGQGMRIAYHHHMAAAIETEAELDLLMKHSGQGLPLLFDAGHMAFAGGDVLRVIDKHHARISHVHTKDVRMGVIEEARPEPGEFPRRGGKGAFTMPGDGSLDFVAIVSGLPPTATRAGLSSKRNRTRRSARRSAYGRALNN